MKLHDFAVLKGDRVVLAKRSVIIGDVKDAWPVIAEMAMATKEVGCRIRVTDETGAIVVLIGVATARLHSRNATAALEIVGQRKAPPAIWRIELTPPKPNTRARTAHINTNN